MKQHHETETSFGGVTQSSRGGKKLTTLDLDGDEVATSDNANHLASKVTEGGGHAQKYVLEIIDRCILWPKSVMDEFGFQQTLPVSLA